MWSFISSELATSWSQISHFTAVTSTRGLKRPNLAARAPQLENAVLIAVTGSEFVLHWRECGVSETGGPNEHAFRRDSKPGQGRTADGRKVDRRDQGDRRATAAAGRIPGGRRCGRRSRRRRGVDRLPESPTPHPGAEAAGCAARRRARAAGRAPRPGQASALTRLQSGRARGVGLEAEGFLGLFGRGDVGAPVRAAQVPARRAVTPLDELPGVTEVSR